MDWLESVSKHKTRQVIVARNLELVDGVVL